MLIYNNLFCLIWKSNGTSFNQTREVSILNLKAFDNSISDELVKSFVKHENDPKRVRSALTNMIIYNLETYNKN